MGVSASLLTFSYLIFARIHVPYMSKPNIHFYLTNEDNIPEVPLMSGTARSFVLLELMHVSKSLQEFIVTSIARKKRMDKLVHIMVPKGVSASTTQPVDKDKTVEDQVGNYNGDAVSEGSSDVGSSKNSKD